MPITLPPNATDASLRRAEIAERLAAACPPGLADEIALVGSTAHGFADDESDLELNLWAEAIPPVEVRIAWLQAAGAERIRVEDAPRDDDSYWIGFRFDGIPGEVGWQTFDTLNQQLDLILSGMRGDRQTLVFAEIIASAIPLRTDGRLIEWQGKLASYPDALLRRFVASAVENWSRYSEFTPLHRLARRGERLALTLALYDLLNQIIRLLYAVNHRWQPSSKWTLTVARQFAPFDLDARIDAILGDPSLERRIELSAQFCLDVLALVPKEYDVSKAVAALRAGLES